MTPPPFNKIDFKNWLQCIYLRVCITYEPNFRTMITIDLSVDRLLSHTHKHCNLLIHLCIPIHKYIGNYYIILYICYRKKRKLRN